MGVSGFYAPPYSVPAFKLLIDLLVDEIKLLDTPGGFRLPCEGINIPTDYRPLLLQRSYWRLDRIIRIGNARYYDQQSRLISLSVESHLVPLSDREGFYLLFNITNRGSHEVHLRVLPKVLSQEGGLVPLKDWIFTPPRPQRADASVHLSVDCDTFYLAPASTSTTQVMVTAEQRFHHGQAVAEPNRQVNRAVAMQLETAMNHFPRLASNHEGLNRYFQRCLITGLSCQWNVPSFKFHPHLATAGLDGGGINTYLWDLSYAPMVLQLLMPEAFKQMLQAISEIDPGHYMALTPDGLGTGAWYAANEAAVADLIWTYSAFKGISEEHVHLLRNLMELNADRLPEQDGLQDFGTNVNLLEMRTNGYEHFVPCFNSLRAYNYRRLADLSELAGLPGAEVYRKKAAAIGWSVQKHLWNEEDQWFDCVGIDGSKHRVDSIRVFNTLLANIVTPAQEGALLQRLIEDDFLGEFGVHSVSKLDQNHYDSVDIDWSGNGSFIGEAPRLAQILWQRQRGDLAWDVIQRLFWMGSRLPYLPQETYAQRPASGPRGRANNIAALAGPNAILIGMLGVEPQPNGSLLVRPQIPSGIEIELSGFEFRGSSLNIRANHRHYELDWNGSLLSRENGSLSTLIPDCSR